MSLLVAVSWSVSAETRQLDIADAVTTKEPAPFIVLPVKCDWKGNMFLRVYEGSPESAPILKISSDGKTAVRFLLNSVEGFSKARIIDFATGAVGEVYVLPQKDADQLDVSLLRFDGDGKFRSQYHMDSSLFDPKQIAEFNSGELLITGTERPNRSGVVLVANPKAFVGIFNGRGQLGNASSLKQTLSRNKVACSRAERLELIGPMNKPLAYL